MLTPEIEFAHRYGSVLGSTFVTMFPDRVGRLIIDGCLDMDGWFRNDLAIQMHDADKTLQTFIDSCVAAGPSACPFHAPSSAEINTNLNSLQEDVRANPVEVQMNDSAITITYGGLRKTIFDLLVAGVDAYPMLAAGLKELEQGNGTIIAEAFARAVHNELNNAEASVAVACSDADPLDKGPSELREYMASINSTFAGMTAMGFMTRCTGWKIHPEGRFKGPVGANTSFPLLVIGNTADPITPLVAAQKAHVAFPGSGLLVQDGPGHKSLTAVSSCTYQAVAAYFANGTLPGAKEGTVGVCPIDQVLFPPNNATARSVGALLQR
ncbi:hypothetical protein AAF712_003795 [Marasmius tenuissimus]|uniref:Peptidase S33 tripeptidyl aminopeptidase-like C-terminal domain-containing protein n=1 Tax=Marasmius tenuissimus TaxID=585030 RepID=A0ABR3A6U8_9AGAR